MPAIDRKSGPFGSRLTSPGSYSLLPLLSCQSQIVVASHVLVDGGEVRLQLAQLIEPPIPPLSTVLPSPMTSNATCARGARELKVTSRISSKHWAAAKGAGLVALRRRIRGCRARRGSPG